MMYPEPAAKTDPQCKFPPFCHVALNLLTSTRGRYQRLNNRHSRDGCRYYRCKSHRHAPVLASDFQCCLETVSLPQNLLRKERSSQNLLIDFEITTRERHRPNRRFRARKSTHLYPRNYAQGPVVMGLQILLSIPRVPLVSTALSPTLAVHDLTSRGAEQLSDIRSIRPRCSHSLGTLNVCSWHPHLGDRCMINAGLYQGKQSDSL